MQSPLEALRAGGLETTLADRAVGLIGIAVILGIAWLVSYDRRKIPWRLVAAGLGLQTAFGVLVLKTTPGRWFFESVGGVVNGLLGFTLEGARFIFGNLVQPTVPVGTPQAGGGLDGAAGFVASTGALFAFGVLPTIIFFSALMSVLYHLGVMQLVVKGLAFVMQRTLRTSGAETLSASGNIFLGQTEAPLLIRPFVGKMTPSELFTVMVGGFATVAGGVLAAYVLMLQDLFPNIAGHLLAASVMNAPAGLMLSKIIRPEVDVPESRDSLNVSVEKPDANVVEAAASGAAVGVQLALNVGAMLMAFIALIAMINFGVSWLGGLVGLEGLTLQGIFGTVLRPLAWVMGVPWADTQYVGGLMGLKTVLNEFVAYAQFGRDLNSGIAISPKSAVIAAYALLGFANFSSIGIQIGGIGGLAPSRRSDIARFGLRAMLAGNLAAFLSATLAGMMM
ncbi:MAG: NupC/NupG family nucleoside CNT transporter [Vicinamibacterales bacterium]|jgi:CNT family concentrative nucleoside transporter